MAEGMKMGYEDRPTRASDQEADWRPQAGRIMETGMDMSDAQDRMSIVGGSHQHLDEQIAQVSKRISLLEERLEVIMGPDFPEKDAGSEKRSGEGLAPIAQALVDSGQRVVRINEHLDRIIGRIQI